MYVQESNRLSLAERVFSVFNPNYLVKRAQAQYTAQLIDQERKRAAFKAAETNRLNENWLTNGASINSYLATELPRMRNRSRWLFRNVPNAISGMNAFTSYCVGMGIRPLATVYDKVRRKHPQTGKAYYEQVENDLWDEECDDLWNEWAVNADIAGSESSPESFYDVQELVLRKWFEDGEAFVHAVVDSGNPTVPLYFEFFEPESLNTQITKFGDNKVVMGVELDKTTNRPVAYHIGPRLSSNTGVDLTPAGVSDKNYSTRYEARYVFHVFKRFRPGQVRGFPLFHGVTEKIFQADEYENATVTAAKIAACMCMFIERPVGVGPTGDFLNAGGSVAAQDSAGNEMTHLQPGMIGTVPKGTVPHVISPQYPGATYGMFTEHSDRQIGAGIEFGLSYEAMTRNTSKASYAGGRLATQRDYQGFRQIIAFLNRKFNTPARALWLDIAVTAEAIIAPGYFALGPATRHNRKYWARHEWIPPAWQIGVNPKDDVSASRDAMRAGISNLDTECAFLGRDWRTVLRIKKKIKDYAEVMGLTLTSDGAISIANGIEDQGGSDEDGDKASNAGGAAPEASPAAAKPAATKKPAAVKKPAKETA